jgi:II/X family phage/plasmid replication protein
LNGSYHKIIKGYNAYNGFYDINTICLGFKNLVENAYNIILPDIENFYLQRLDITKVFDLESQENIKCYMNNLKLLNYPRRNSATYCDFGVDTLYFKGSTTTLKIYNKLKEFKKNDRSKLKKYDNFDLLKFENDIKGFLRFECEIKKKKLKSLYNIDNIKIIDVKYEDFEKVWCNEFMKILKFKNSDIKKVREKQCVLIRLKTFYSDSKANNLYSFFLSLKVDGYDVIRNNMSRTTFYRKVTDLKNAGVDFSQSDFTILEDNKLVDFDIFSAKEVV